MIEEKNAVSVQSFSISSVIINNSQPLPVTCLYGLPAVYKIQHYTFKRRKKGISTK